MTILSAVFYVVLALGVYLAALAVAVVVFDSTLQTPQKFAQCFVSVLIPLLGPLTVLFMAHTVSPELLRWVPWPFRNMISDKEIKRYSSEEDQSRDSYI
jgi:hypothetical protein